MIAIGLLFIRMLCCFKSRQQLEAESMVLRHQECPAAASATEVRSDPKNENPFWRAIKIHGELLKLGTQVA